jgi:hypothetical protein
MSKDKTNNHGPKIDKGHKINEGFNKQANIGENKAQQERLRKAAEIPPQKPKEKK